MAAAQQAHVVVHVADAAAGFGASAGQAQADEQPADSAALPLAPHALQLWVLNKADLLEPDAAEAAAAQLMWPAAARAAAQQAACEAADGGDQQPAATAGVSDQQPTAAAAEVDRQPIVISCRTGQGIEQLLGALQQHVAVLVAQGGDDGMERALPTRARHRWAQSTVGRTGSDWQGRAWWLASGLEKASVTSLHIAPRARCPLPHPCAPCRHHLSEAVAALQRYEASAGSQLEVACEELRAAARALGRVTGAVDTEEVLGRIFEEFCIGK